MSLTDDALAGSFRVYQQKKGHRYSLDDVLTAREAVLQCPGAERYLDLGCGIGSVLLMVLHKVRVVSAVGIEAQRASFELVCRNVARNRLEHKVRLIQGDFRDRQFLSELAKEPFDLITGTPPYMPVGQGTISPISQRAYARVELRGGVEDYVLCGAQLLAQGGKMVVCADARRPERVRNACKQAGLAPLLRRDVTPRQQAKDPLFTVWCLAHASFAKSEVVQTPFVARNEIGGRTEMAHDLRRFFDLPVNVEEPPSPGKRTFLGRQRGRNGL